MKNLLFNLCFFLLLLLSPPTWGQFTEDSKQYEGFSELFRSNQILPIKLEYSNLDINKKTNDSTYLKTNLSYKVSDNSWKTFEIKMRARGNFRRAKCYYKPLKIKIKKAEYKNTLFDKNKSLKIVLPCFKKKGDNDNVIIEYMAYRIYEILSPYGFKTRLLEVDYTEIKRKKIYLHQLKGIIIEDVKKVAKRYDGKVYEGLLHPLNLDNLTSTQVDLFQFMISNTDYSSGYQHNGKIIYVDKKLIPIPYDFDMSGLVNTSYSTVSLIQNEKLEITDVTQRLYRGFKRDEKYLYQVRKEFIAKQVEVFEHINSLETLFENPKKFTEAKEFISTFYRILHNDERFKKEIVDMARTQ